MTATHAFGILAGRRAGVDPNVIIAVLTLAVQVLPLVCPPAEQTPQGVRRAFKGVGGRVRLRTACREYGLNRAGARRVTDAIDDQLALEPDETIEAVLEELRRKET